MQFFQEDVVTIKKLSIYHCIVYEYLKSMFGDFILL